ncbi:MAG: hypothetical protein ACRDPK_13885, partial [Carbonactinosporaceae bacterium]
LTVGAWLLHRSARSARPARSAWRGRVSGYAVAAGTSSGDCRALGERLAAGPDRVALLVMGDGSARRSERAPGHVDHRAADFDASVAGALGEADPVALLGLDAVLAEELMAAGRESWQVLAGAAGRERFAGELLYADAPYGVGYFVATWLRR